MKNVSIKILLCLTCLLFTQCYSTKWNSLHTEDQSVSAPAEVLEVFNSYPDSVMVLEALSPAYAYQYDIGEKDDLYGKDSLALRFKKVEVRLAKKMPEGKILAALSFVDGQNNSIEIKNVDLLRLVPKLEGPDELVNAEMLLKEFNRFGYVFRKEHGEFDLKINLQDSVQATSALEGIYRCKVTNNCLSAGKWELEVTSEDYSDFGKRIKGEENLNQNKIIAHSWFYLDECLYESLLKIKNPNKDYDLTCPYDSLSDMAEQAVVDFDKLRNPLKFQIGTDLLEVGHQTSKKIKPVDVEQFYKKEFGLVLNDEKYSYASILDSTVTVAQFRDEGFYNDSTPKKFDFGWMKYMDSVSIETIDVEGTDAYVQISLSGKWSPYKVTLGNVDMAQIGEQKLLGFLFGVNTYPKGRRYNPMQSTLAYDADLLPDYIKSYLMLTDNTSQKWINNQYKGIEKVYLTYESLEREVLVIYILSYERILPVWMAKVKLPRNFRETVRIRKSLYNY